MLSLNRANSNSCCADSVLRSRRQREPRLAETRRRRKRFVIASLAACAWAYSWTPIPSAQGADTQPPAVTVQSPTINATGVSTGINVRVTFSEPIQPATLAMELRNSSNVLQAALVTYDAASATATLNPNSDLAGSQTFTATVSGVRDLAGNLMAPAAWSFTTAAAGFQDQALPQTGLEEPTALQFATDGRLFVAEKSGRIKVFDSLSDTTPTIVVDLQNQCSQFLGSRNVGHGAPPELPCCSLHLRPLYVRRRPAGIARSTLGRGNNDGRRLVHRPRAQLLAAASSPDDCHA